VEVGIITPSGIVNWAVLAAAASTPYQEPSADESELCHRICTAVPGLRYVAVLGGAAHMMRS
jgi:hypothetical protein